MANRIAAMLTTPARPRPKPRSTRAKTRARPKLSTLKSARIGGRSSHNIEKERYPLRIGDAHIVKRQELNLQQKQQQNWKDDERRQGDEFEHKPKNAGAEFRRPGEDLDENIARQEPP